MKNMEVILLENVENLGVFGSLVCVANGFARNFLIPTKKAVLATASAKKEFATRRTEYELQQTQLLAEKTVLKDSILAIGVINITAKAGIDSKLFGSITANDIVQAIKNVSGIELPKTVVQLREHIKRLGQYEIVLKIHHNLTANITVSITSAN